MFGDRDGCFKNVSEEKTSKLTDVSYRNRSVFILFYLLMRKEKTRKFLLVKTSLLIKPFN